MKETLCRRNRCCPTVEVSEKEYIIEDDDGTIITLNENNIKNLIRIYLEKEIDL